MTLPLHIVNTWAKSPPNSLPVDQTSRLLSAQAHRATGRKAAAIEQLVEEVARLIAGASIGIQ